MASEEASEDSFCSCKFIELLSIAFPHQRDDLRMLYKLHTGNSLRVSLILNGIINTTAYRPMFENLDTVKNLFLRLVAHLARPMQLCCNHYVHSLNKGGDVLNNVQGFIVFLLFFFWDDS